MFAVLTRIANEEDLLKPGMNADVSVVIGREDNVLALPNSGIRTVQEAARLADALQIPGDVNALAQEAQRALEGGEPTESAEPEEDEEMINGRRVSEIATMSQGERMEWFQGLSGAERGRVMQIFQQMREGGGQAGGGETGAARPAFVFHYDETGAIAMKAIMIGLGNFDYTHVLSGLAEGEEVVSIPLSLLQQQEMLDWIRGRRSLPGIGS
jgi:hypothetical protein